MHIEIEFLGTVEQKAEQYISVLDQLENWQKINEIDVKMTYSDPVLTLILPDRESYSMWVMTWPDSYRIIHYGYED